MIDRQSLLRSPSEELVLEGYRLWSWGIISGDYSHWQKAWNLFAVRLGTQEGRLTLDALSRFSKTLGLCAACPLKTSPVGCRDRCRDERIILGLLSAIQHDEESSTALFLDALVNPAESEAVLVAAEVLATTLACIGEVLKPVPRDTLREIVAETVSGHTIH